jgi:hypothetical protein
MISRCTWVLLAAVAFLFLNAYLSWPPKPVPGQLDFDYSQLPSRPHEQWLMVSVLGAIALGVSLLADLIRKHQNRA